jgi:dihydroorotate dehydrogenase electron transfer subunit
MGGLLRETYAMVDLDSGVNAAPDLDGQGGTRVPSGREFESEIVAVDEVMGDSTLLTLSLPQGLATSVRPGHFVDVLCRVPGSFDPLLRRPYSIFRTDSRANTMTLMVRPFGRGSTWLSQRKTGEVLDVLGPLGNTYEIKPRSRNLLMVAGGVGVAPLVFLTDLALSRNLNVTFLMGSASADGLLAPAFLPSAVEYVTATDDGSGGHHGFVTDLVPNYMQWADQIFSCGPEPMFRSLRDVANPHRIQRKPTVQVSVERTMACGLGACLGCVVETRRGMQTSCVQGPIYDMDDVIW